MKHNPSTLGRLLTEISWEGNARHYRYGGAGYENVLTAEVFQVMDFLPRSHFFGAILAGAHGGATSALETLVREVEKATFGLLPGDVDVGVDEETNRPIITLQPDAIIESQSIYCLVEAKRARKGGAFQPPQLARYLLAAWQHANGRLPMVLLVLDKAPPVLVRGHGRLSILDAISKWLPEELQKLNTEQIPSAETLLEAVDSIFCYTTWSEISTILQQCSENIPVVNESITASIRRTAQAA